jgi:hypothetical protein
VSVLEADSDRREGTKVTGQQDELRAKGLLRQSLLENLCGSIGAAINDYDGLKAVIQFSVKLAESGQQLR